MQAHLLHRIMLVVLLGFGAACGRTIDLGPLEDARVTADATRDAGSEPDAGSGDAARDAGRPDAAAPPDATSPDPACPCPSLCYRVRGGRIGSLAVLGLEEVWFTRGGQVFRYHGGAVDAVAVPELASADSEVRVFRAEVFSMTGTPWLIRYLTSAGDDVRVEVHRREENEWVEVPLPGNPPPGAHRLAHAIMGSRLFVALQGTDALYEWHDGDWRLVRRTPNGIHWLSASTSFLAVTLSGEPWHEVMSPDGSWAALPPTPPEFRLPPPAELPEGQAYTAHVAGDLVILSAVESVVFDGPNASVVPEIDGVVAAGTHRGVPHVVTSSDTLVSLEDPAAPESSPLPLAASAAAFPAEGAPWAGGSALMEFDGVDWTVRTAAEPGAFIQHVRAAYGTADDLWLLERWSVDASAILHRIRGMVYEHYKMPLAEGELAHIHTANSFVRMPDGRFLVGTKSSWAQVLVADPERGRVEARFDLAHFDPAQRDAAVAGHGEDLFVGAGPVVYRFDEGELVEEQDLSRLREDAGAVKAIVAHASSSGDSDLWVLTSPPALFRRESGAWSAVPGWDGAFGARGLGESFHATPEGAFLAGMRDTGGSAEEYGVFEWDGSEWLWTAFPTWERRLLPEVTGSGEDVIVYDSELSRWRRQGPGRWAEDRSCRNVTDGPVHHAWWPAGASDPWYFAYGGTILAPRILE